MLLLDFKSSTMSNSNQNSKSNRSQSAVKYEKKKKPLYDSNINLDSKATPANSTSPKDNNAGNAGNKVSNFNAIKPKTATNKKDRNYEMDNYSGNEHDKSNYYYSYTYNKII